MQTTLGDIELVWGINRWVLLETSRGRVQRQVSTSEGLAALFRDVGLPSEEAQEMATTCWRERPAEAGLSSAHGDEALWRSTGLSRSASALVLLAVIALFALFSYLIYLLAQ